MRRAQGVKATGRRWLTAAVAAAIATAAAGCGSNGDEIDRTTNGDPLPRRAGTLVIDTCPMDSFQRSTLAAASTRAVIDEVILLCLYGREDGSVGPDAPETEQWLRDDIVRVRESGYRVSLGLTVGEGPLSWYGTARSTELVLSPAWRERVAGEVQAWAGRVDGVEVALPAPLKNEARSGVTELVRGLAAAVRPAGTLGVFAPPSVRTPSDLPGGDAYDLPALAGSLDRVRVMTLDWSCCSRPGGPSTDAAWAAEAAEQARLLAPGVQRSVTMPLFGTDFGDRGSRSLTYLEATALARYHDATIGRDLSGAPHFAYTDEAGVGHDVWFDDLLSTQLTLGAWAGGLPGDVGVLYYGLGAEEPDLWRGLARSMRP